MISFWIEEFAEIVQAVEIVENFQLDEIFVCCSGDGDGWVGELFGFCFGNG